MRTTAIFLLFASCTPEVVIHKCDRLHVDDPVVKALKEQEYHSALLNGANYALLGCHDTEHIGACVLDSIANAMNHYRTLHP